MVHIGRYKYFVHDYGTNNQQHPSVSVSHLIMIPANNCYQALVLVYLGRNIWYMIIIPSNQQPLSVSVSHMIMMVSTKKLAQDIGTDLLSYKY